MKTLIFHCSEFRSQDIYSKNLPVECESSLVVMITFEVGDKERKVKKLIREIKKASRDFSENVVVVFPFSHLSNNLLDYNKSINLLNMLREKLGEINLEIKSATFGTDKEILLNVIGHPDNVRFRSF